MIKSKTETNRKNEKIKGGVRLQPSNFAVQKLSPQYFHSRPVAGAQWKRKLKIFTNNKLRKIYSMQRWSENDLNFQPKVTTTFFPRVGEEGCRGQCTRGGACTCAFSLFLWVQSDCQRQLQFERFTQTVDQELFDDTRLFFPNVPGFLLCWDLFLRRWTPFPVGILYRSLFYFLESEKETSQFSLHHFFNFNLFLFINGWTPAGARRSGGWWVGNLERRKKLFPPQP